MKVYYNYEDPSEGVVDSIVSLFPGTLITGFGSATFALFACLSKFLSVHVNVFLFNGKALAITNKSVEPKWFYYALAATALPAITLVLVISNVVDVIKRYRQAQAQVTKVLMRHSRVAAKSISELQNSISYDVTLQFKTTHHERESDARMVSAMLSRRKKFARVGQVITLFICLHVVFFTAAFIC